ncbi:hypothetical protein HDF10_001566 [Edaphobacter lichenicola]|uniref:Uncharacterized protein n=1 Tax=Tunturiibacter lichenicola TaxID=2051959 RepID=A0A7W8N4I1_9BACT|nr:hypothetical protein [Edaphobacter lichenicola]
MAHSFKPRIMYIENKGGEIVKLAQHGLGESPFQRQVQRCTTKAVRCKASRAVGSSRIISISRQVSTSGFQGPNVTAKIHSTQQTLLLRSMTTFEKSTGRKFASYRNTSIRRTLRKQTHNGK